MRILVAYDGSPGAGVAVDLVRAIPWPAGSSIRFLTAVDRAPLTSSSYPVPDEGQHLLEAAAAEASADGLAVAASIRDRGITVDAAIAYGRPSTAIEEAITSFAADVVVLGSRGRGPISGLFLGSVSAEVAERASRPVLIARSPNVGPIVFATDGSPASRAAESFLAASAMFADGEVYVVSVATLAYAYTGLPGPSMHDVALEAEAKTLADDAAMRLSAAGLRPRSRVRMGDAAAQIVGLAQAVDAGLIVIGSRGRLGFTGMLLGSVARNVLYSSGCSVLVVREDQPPAAT
ncbi:MAG TPA: universal stress protein [Candidatus Limnocylindrales bacterium]|nr:universal stress protein [Candidatus Limnocylindrales bacterium]